MSKVKFSHPALEVPIFVFVKYAVCPTCSGHGTTDRRDIDCSQLVDDMVQDGDFEGQEMYRQGHFDQICSECKGLRVVEIPIDVPKWALEAIAEYDEMERECRAEEEAERRFGC